MMQKNKVLLIYVFLLLSHFSFSQTADSAKQKADSIKRISHFSGSVSVTNNGISIVPTFSLGKPAAIFMLSARKNRFSFDPDLRFSLGESHGAFFSGPGIK
jgi:hypothetical protein